MKVIKSQPKASTVTGSSTPPSGFYRSAIPPVILNYSYRAYVRARQKWLAGLPQWHEKKIADIGCGNGDALRFLAKNNSMHGFDLDAPALEEAKEHGFVTHLVDLNMLELQPESYDVVCALNVASMAESPIPFFASLKDAAKPEGTVLVTLATFGGIRCITRTIINILRVRHSAVYLPTPWTFVGDVRSSGLKIKKVTYGFSPLNGWTSTSRFAAPFASFVYIEASA